MTIERTISRHMGLAGSENGMTVFSRMSIDMTAVEATFWLCWKHGR
jgi:hypothetical protein